MTAVADTRVTPRTAGATHDFAGTGVLLRLALRRDRVMAPAWVLVLALSMSSALNQFKSMYGTAAERADVATDMGGNSSLRALYGVIFDDSIGGLVAWRMGAFAPLVAAAMSVLIIVRHTREEEETGRQEALSSAMVGRRAGLTAALITAAIANTAIVLLVAAVMAGEGGTGALALALAIGITGMAFAGLAAVAAQITENARLARGMAFGVLGLAFVLRMAGDAANGGTSGHLLVWFSPLGWAENLRPFAQERWWALLLIALLAAVAFAVAYSLAGRRDVGASFIASRPGPAAAGSLLTGVYGLAWRLQRGTVIGWALGFAFTGIVFGGVSDGAEDILGDNEKTREIFERMGGQQGITDSFLASMVGMLGLVSTIFAVGAVLRLRSEETDQRAEPLLSNAVSRLRWAASHLVVAYLGTIVVLTVGGLMMGLGYGYASGDLGGQLPRVLGATVAQIPAIWVVTSAAAFLFGVLPRYAAVAWGVVGVVIAVGWVGAALDLPEGAESVSPFEHLPKLPGHDVSLPPFLWLTLLAVGLTAVGLAGLRRRDVG